jgi:hypothetical protein
MQVLLYTIIGAGYTLFLAIVILLVRTYWRTREVGFIWLGAAALAWPLLARLLESGLRFERHKLRRSSMFRSKLSPSRSCWLLCFI